MEGIALPLPPPVVCLCGSTRFKQAWIAENARFTGEGYIVLAVGLWGHHERVFPDAETKKRLDELHLRKIDLCEMVWVLDVGGYIGESTRNEIAYAEAHGKIVRYLSNEFPDYIEPVDPILAAKEKAEAQLCSMKAALERIAAYDWVKGGRIIFGNADLPGDAGQFYRGYNAGIKGQFEATKAIAEAELRRRAGGKE